MLRRALAFLLLLAPTIALAASPITVPSVAALRAGNFLNSPTVQLTSWYAGLNKGGGLLTYDSADTTTADNTCTVFVDAAGHRFKRPVDGDLWISMCGAYSDDSHDDKAAIQQAGVVASALPSKTVRLGGGKIKILSTVNTYGAPGVSFKGEGFCSTSDVSLCNTFIDANSMTSGYAFDTPTPNGTTLFNAPKYYDFSILLAYNNNAGGCIRYNSLAGGFTNDGTSQYYMSHPRVERVACSMQAGASVQQIGFACYKCFEGVISNVDTLFGLNGADIEGSDNITINDASRFQGSSGPLVRFVTKGTDHFGNINVLQNAQLLYPTDFGQTLSSFVELSGTSDVLRDVHIEGQFANALSVIAVNNGFSHTIEGNDIDALQGASPVPCWLKVSTDVVNLTAINNGVGGSIMGRACFNNGSDGASYFYIHNVNVRQILTHMGNGIQGDNHWPSNTLASDRDLQFSPTNVQSYSPSFGGLSGNGAGANAQMLDGAFDLNASGLGSTNYLDFGPTDRPAATGTLTVNALMSGSGTMHCTLTDAGVVKGYSAVTLTPLPSWGGFTPATAVGSAGARCYADAGGTSVRLWQVVLTQ